MLPAMTGSPTPDLHRDVLQLRTNEPVQFVDLTEWVAERLRRWRIRDGIAQLQVQHTTAAIVVNENEPLLLEDFRAMLERIAPEQGPYAHDDPERRRVHLVPGERANGHAHARALLLGSSKVFQVSDGRIELGRWQSILLVELDGPRRRSIGLSVLGYRRPRG